MSTAKSIKCTPANPAGTFNNKNAVKFTVNSNAAASKPVAAAAAAVAAPLSSSSSASASGSNTVVAPASAESASSVSAPASAKKANPAREAGQAITAAASKLLAIPNENKDDLEAARVEFNTLIDTFNREMKKISDKFVELNDVNAGNAADIKAGVTVADEFVGTAKGIIDGANLMGGGRRKTRGKRSKKHGKRGKTHKRHGKPSKTHKKRHHKKH
jgi:hypothetical protein